MGNKFKDSDKSQGQFISVIPDEQITEGSFDETVQLLIDHVLDISSFEKGYNNANGGAPAYPPSVLLKVILAAYSRGVTGSRKIEKLCLHNTVFMCLSGFLTPDHSTIAAFVSKQSKNIENLFVQIVMECDHLGLVSGNCFSIDGTKLSSNASKDSSGTVADFEKKYKKIKSGIRFLLHQHKEEDQSGRVDEGRRERELKRIKKLRKLSKDLETPLREMKDKIGSKGQAKKTNLTASDIAEEAEQKAFIPMLNQVENNLGISLKGKKVLADAGFNTISNAAYCFDHEIDAYLADGGMRSRNPLYKDRDRKKPKSRQRQFFKPNEFHYDEKNNRSKEQGRQVSIKKGAASNLPRPYDLMKEKIDSAQGRDIYSHRMGMVEPVFGNIKHNHGLRWLSLRGLSKVRGQWLLFCMVHNMVKIQRYGEYEPA